MADVTLKKVGKTYGRHEVISDLGITIKDGECFTFLGPSGCGKTVILRLIAGFEHPTAGEIYIGDRLVSSVEKKVHVPPEARKIGVVFQDYAVWPHKTVYENVIYPMQMQKIAAGEAKERTRAAVEQVGLVREHHHQPVFEKKYAHGDDLEEELVLAGIVLGLLEDHCRVGGLEFQAGKLVGVQGGIERVFVDEKLLDEEPPLLLIGP